jgi:uncharacterized membrane protein required for colicin V production
MDVYTITDIAIGIVTLVFLSIGLYRGISGELASCMGFAGGIAVAFFLYPQALSLAGKVGCTPSFLPIVGCAIDLGFGIVAYGLIRVLVNKFISTCIPQPTNAILGMFLGLVKAGGIVVALMWFNIVGINETVLLEVKSPVLCRIAEVVSQYSNTNGEVQ